MQCTSVWVKILWMQYSKRHFVPWWAFKSCQNIGICYFKAGFDIIKLRSLVCNWASFVFICLLKNYRSLQKVIFKYWYLWLLIPCLCWTISDLLNNNSIKKKFHLLRAWTVYALKVFNVSFLFLEVIKA